MSIESAKPKENAVPKEIAVPQETDRWVELGLAIARYGLADCHREVEAMLAVARVRGASPILIAILGNPDELEVVRLRAFARLSAEVSWPGEVAAGHHCDGRMAPSRPHAKLRQGAADERRHRSHDGGSHDGQPHADERGGALPGRAGSRTPRMIPVVELRRLDAPS